MGSRSKSSTSTTNTQRTDLRYNYDLNQEDNRIGASGSGVAARGGARCEYRPVVAQLHHHPG